MIFISYVMLEHAHNTFGLWIVRILWNPSYFLETFCMIEKYVTFEKVFLVDIELQKMYSLHSWSKKKFEMKKTENVTNETREWGMMYLNVY